MIKIAHRGNRNGPSSRENEPAFILEAIQQGLDVEVDVWFYNRKWYLGHDNPTYLIDFKFFENWSDKLWVHCKNIEAVVELRPYADRINFFWHEADKYTLTSRGFIMVCPNSPVPDKGGAVMMPEWYPQWDIRKTEYVCSDYT